MTGLDLLAVGLRALVYAGAIAVAGGALFAAGFPRASVAIAPALRRQMVGGFLLLLACEPLRYAAFQLAIADGDVALAFGPAMRWMGFETPIGQAAAVRLVAAAIVTFAAPRHRSATLAAALVIIGSFLLEGHTASSHERVLLAALLFLHLAAVHWWLGALLPLIALTRCAEPATVIATTEAFGARAVWIVAGLLAAGVLLAALLTGGVVRLDSAYQQRLLIKILLVAAILAIAAFNKLRLTPLLRQDYVAGARRLRASVRLEVAVALAILAASAWLVATSPHS
jgi:copper resistance protein D